jgi:hypothetical protein
VSATSVARLARKGRRCDGCLGRIRVGDVYLVHTLYPSSSDYTYTSGHPVRVAECSACANRYDRGLLIAAHDPVGRRLVQGILDRVAIQNLYPAPAAQ